MRVCLATFRTLLLASLVAAASAAHAQAWPDRPITMVVPFPPGGVADTVARPVADAMSRELKQPVVVENKPGAGGLIATQEEARSAADGYTLLLSTGAQMAIEPALNPKAGYDPLKDFVHVIHLGDAPLVLLAVPSLPASGVMELIAMSKAKPGSINTASTGNGTYTHLTLELFKAASGANLTHIPYKGAAPAFNDLMGGQVQTMFTTTASAQPYTSSQKLRALAVTAPKRSPMMPDVPTFAEVGVPIDVSVWIGIAVPAGTPPASSSTRRTRALAAGTGWELMRPPARTRGWRAARRSGRPRCAGVPLRCRPHRAAPRRSTRPAPPC